MSDFISRARLAIRKKSKAAKKKIVAKALKLAYLYTPVDKGVLRASVREVEINELVSYIVWGNSETMTDSGKGYEFYVAFGTKYQSAQLYHVTVARALQKELSGARIGAVITATPTSAKITIPKNRQLMVV